LGPLASLTRVDACNPPTASAPDLGSGRTRRPRDLHLSHARLRTPRLSPLRARPRARPIWARARGTLTRRLGDPPVSKRRQHRTVRCNSGATAISAPTATCDALNARAARRGQAHPYWCTGHSTVHVRCATGHPGGPRRQSSNGRTQRLLVTWLSHRTCPVCTGLSGVPSNRQPHQTASLVVGAINNPNHPPFIASKFSSFQPLYKS
jgi:hypothetical protein